MFLDLNIPLPTKQNSSHLKIPFSNVHQFIPFLFWLPIHPFHNQAPRTEYNWSCSCTSNIRAAWEQKNDGNDGKSKGWCRKREESDELKLKLFSWLECWHGRLTCFLPGDLYWMSELHVNVPVYRESKWPHQLASWWRIQLSKSLYKPIPGSYRLQHLKLGCVFGLALGTSDSQRRPPNDYRVGDYCQNCYKAGSRMEFDFQVRSACVCNLTGSVVSDAMRSNVCKTLLAKVVHKEKEPPFFCSSKWHMIPSARKHLKTFSLLQIT